MKFATKVKKFLKRGKNGQINAFYSDVISLYKDQIDLLERENKKIEGEYGKLAKAKEDKLNFVFNIDLDRLSDVEDREKYAEEYAKNLLRYDNYKIKPLEVELENNKDQIQILINIIQFLEKAEPIIEDDSDDEKE